MNAVIYDGRPALKYSQYIDGELKNVRHMLDLEEAEKLAQELRSVVYDIKNTKSQKAKGEK